MLRLVLTLFLAVSPLAPLVSCSGDSSPSKYGELETIVLTVDGLTTEEESLEVAKTLTGLDSVVSCVVSIEGKTATCEAAKGTDPNTLVKALEGTKYKAHPK